MPYVYQYDVVEVAIKTRWGGQVDMNNIFNFKLASAGPYTDAAALASLQAWVNGFCGELDDVQWNGVTYLPPLVVNITQNRIMGNLVAGSTGGKRAVEPLPSGMSFLVHFRTVNRRIRGRKFFGGLTYDMVTRGTWTSACIAEVNSAALYCHGITGPGGVYWANGVWSRKYHAFYDESGYVLVPTVAHQRRRKVYYRGP